MESVLGLLETVALVGAGLLVRLALLVLVFAVVAAPVVLAIQAVRGYVTLRRALALATVDGVVWPSRFYYAPGHTWVRRVGFGALRVGIDGLAQRLLAGTAAVELPRPGTVLRAGQVAGAVTCGDKRGEIRSPVGGTVTAVNEALARDASLMTREPYARGWLFTVKPSDAGYRRFPRGRPALEWLEQERTRLARFLERELGVAAADGGEPLFSAPSLLTVEQWATLTSMFLGPEGSG